MPKNDPKKVKISICSLLKGISEKVAENRPPIKSKFRGGILFHIFSKIPFKGLKIEFFTFRVQIYAFLGHISKKVIL